MKTESPIKHGTVYAYKRRGCRCDDCRAAQTEDCRKFRERYRRKHGGQVPSQAVRANRPPPLRRECVDCAKPLRRCLAEVPRCRPCFLVERSRLRAAKARRDRAAKSLERAAAGTAGTRVWTQGVCASCGDPFLRVGLSSSYCSSVCSRRDRPKGRRFKIRTSVRRAIYERDGWVCQLCDEPVDPNLPPLDDWAASLDHIECQSWALIPDHSPSNLRLAHRWCNSVRGDESHHTEAVLRVAA